MKIKLMKSSFYKEEETKKDLCEFIKNAKILSMNEECEKFEKSFSQFQGRKYSLFVTSGSSANLLLIQSLLNLGKLEKGSRIGVSSLTWSTNIMPLIQLGLEPVLIDCEIDTVNVSLDKIKEREIDALFLTNALGFCSDIDKIKNYCEEKSILFIEDTCESMGTEYNGTKLGNFGLASTFSFFVGHHLSTIEGGMICTDNKELYENLLMIRIHGWGRNLPKESQDSLKEKYGIDDFYNRYTFYDLAYNARPSEINGFLGNAQLKYVEEVINCRERNFKKIHAAIEKNEDIINLNVGSITKISNFGIPFIFRNKGLFERYQEKFENSGVEIRPIISGNMENQPFFKKYCSAEQGKCENAEFIHGNGFYCGNNPELTEEELNFICELISK
jgi:CDP-4-dehydro-6-deoxyglucose reductase, E1